MPPIPSQSIIEFSGAFRYLSNFYPHPVLVRGEIAKTVEHAFQALKATNKTDFHKVLNAGTARQAKWIGRNIAMRSDWEDIKDQVMLALLLEKFKPRSPLRVRLLATGERELLEGNTWHDHYWGVCYCGDCPSGENRLGELLMLVRDIARPYAADS